MTTMMMTMMMIIVDVFAEEIMEEADLIVVETVEETATVDVVEKIEEVLYAGIDVKKEFYDVDYA